MGHIDPVELERQLGTASIGPSPLKLLTTVDGDLVAVWVEKDEGSPYRSIEGCHCDGNPVLNEAVVKAPCVVRTERHQYAQPDWSGIEIGAR